MNLTPFFWMRLIAILISIFVILNNHSKTDFKSYHGTLWADAGGYYHYLPATFKYTYDAKYWPKDAANKVGNGFEVKDGKIVSKYFIGSAILNFPAYRVAEIIGPKDPEFVGGFDKRHQYAVLFSTMIYVFLGLYFLEKIWQYYVKPETLYFIIPLLYLSTNLFYYTVDKGGMTHGQSFFLFCLAWFGLHRFNQSHQKRWFFLFTLSTALAILVRPTAAMVIPFFYLVLNDPKSSISDNIKVWLARPSLLISHFIIIGIVFLPQLFYWKYAAGSYFNYAYGDEGFDFTNPHFLEVLFSPNNGLIIYTPLILFFIWGCIKQNIETNLGWHTLVFFGIILFVFSSWESWAYGCSLGQRSFIEYYPILAFPLFLYLDKAGIWHKKALRYSSILVVLLLIAIQLKYIYTYDDCFHAGDWDYSAWLKLLTS